MRAVVSPKEERKEREGEMRGGPVRETTVRGREPTGRQEKEKCTVHKDGECGTMLWPREKGKLKGLTQTAFTGHATK